jgi:hypothetical protein
MITDAIAAITTAAGMDDHVTSHVLRHTFGAEFRSGVGIVTVAELMGHASHARPQRRSRGLCRVKIASLAIGATARISNSVAKIARDHDSVYQRGPSAALHRWGRPPTTRTGGSAMERCEFRFIVADTELRSIGRRWPMPGVVALAAWRFLMRS